MTVRVGVVGGGIAGLYTAWRLANTSRSVGSEFEISVFETKAEFGGRIETVCMAGYLAEFGPMRFEPGIQPYLNALRESLGLNWSSFAPPVSEPSDSPTARYHFRRTEIPRSGGDVTTLGMLRLGVLRMFQGAMPDELRTVELDATSSQGEVVQRWIDSFRDDVPPMYDELRRFAKLGDRPLRDLGIWNALSEVLSPDAVRFIRDEGTFYHLIPDNPNAVEWGVFWLRLFRTEAKSLSSIHGGSGCLVTSLVDVLEQDFSDRVYLRPAHEVLAAEEGRRGAIALRVIDRSSSRQFRDEFDHVVFALPLKPLRRLSVHFPDIIRKDLYAAFGFPLLKAFLVTKKPWWTDDTAPQSGAGAVPTRELHYWTAEQGRKAGGHPEDGTGLVMLYTDHPASEYWRMFVRGALHDQAEVDRSPHLRASLAKFLLVEAKQLANRMLSRPCPDRSVPQDVHEWARQLSLPPDAPMSEIVDELRQRDSEKGEANNIDVVRESVEEYLVAEGMPTPMVRVISSPTEQTEAELLDAIVTCGVRDWSREPFAAGCHAWAIGARSWQVLARIPAFWLAGASRDVRLGNAHICGEALSDYQGFIEGALRTSERVVRAISQSIEEGDDEQDDVAPANMRGRAR